MTKSELDTLQKVLRLLQQLAPVDELVASPAAPWRCPVRRFVAGYLIAEPRSDLSCAELWTFFSEIVAARELEPLRKQIFMRRLSGVMEEVYNLKKSHNIPRNGKLVRGLRGVTIKDPSDSASL